MTTESDEGNGRHRDDLTEEENAIRAAELEKLSEIDFSKVTGDFDDKVEEVIDDNLTRLLSGGEDCINYSAGNGNVTDGRKGNTGRRATTKEENGRYEYVQKYSISETVLAEAVIIDQKAFFAVSDFTYSTDIKLTLQKEIRLDDDRRTVLKPLDLISYINKPYRFKSKEEFWDNIKRAKEQTLDALYSSVKAIWKIYVDADNFHIRICSADTTFTYKQDRVGSTHYLFFVGDNDSGKSANLTIIDYLAYRTMCSVGITSSNIYQFLGSRDEGVGTICEDEADNIDKDTEKMRLYKSGYTKGKVVPKTDTTYSRTQYKFNAYCFKALAAERLPS